MYTGCGALESVLHTEVSFILRVLYQRFHCINPHSEDGFVDLYTS